MKYLVPSSNGKFLIHEVENSKNKIVPGRLYGYKGIVVRAKELCSNGCRHVVFHKKLHGFVKDSELVTIPASLVKIYLSQA